MTGYMYILECADGSYYTGSTTDLERRLAQHQSGEGANHTKKHLPVKLVYFEEYQRIDDAFYREKQVHGWSRRKKEALINGTPELLPKLAQNYTQFPQENMPSTSSGTEVTDIEQKKLVISTIEKTVADANPVAEPVAELVEAINPQNSI